MHHTFAILHIRGLEWAVMRVSNSVVPVVVVGVLLSLGAMGCGGDTPASPSGGNATATSTGAGGANNGARAQATLAIHLTDSPFGEANAFLLTFDGVSVHNADTGEWIALQFPSGSFRTCDLKQLEDGGTDLLGTTLLTVGTKYTQIRLNVASAFLYFSPDDGSIGSEACASGITLPPGGVPVDIPSGEVKLSQEFTVTGTGTLILLDFDGDRSVRQTGSGQGHGQGQGQGQNQGQGASKYIMTPVVRVVSIQ